jgi:hypothetical protein
LTDYTGALPPVIEFRTRQQASETGEHLLIGVSAEKTDKDGFVTKINRKQRKMKKKLETQLLKKRAEELITKLKNKKKNERRKTKLRNMKNKEEPDEFGDVRDTLKFKQKSGAVFPTDTCTAKCLSADLKAIALTQYTLKRGLKEFGNNGVVALGKEMEQLHTRKVAKPVDGSHLTRDQKRASLRYLVFLTKK